MTRRRAQFTIRCHTDYKVYLDLVLSTPETKSRGQKSALAEAVGCQLSYLSRVLNGDVHFSLEQAEACSRYLMLSPDETSYFMALVSEARAGTTELKAYWRSELKRLRVEQRELQDVTELKQSLSSEEMSVYYSEWYFSAIHVLASIPQFQTAEQLSAILNLPSSVIRRAITFLESARLLRRDGASFVVTETQLHLAKSSPLINQHATNWKLRSIQASSRAKNHDLHYVSVVSLAREDFIKIRELMLECVGRMRETIRASKDEIAAVYIMDLFELDESNRDTK